jgi:hypothetical protein
LRERWDLEGWIRKNSRTNPWKKPQKYIQPHLLPFNGDFEQNRESHLLAVQSTTCQESALPMQYLVLSVNGTGPREPFRMPPSPQHAEAWVCNSVNN